MSLLTNPPNQATLLDIKAKTDNLPAVPADQSSVTGIDTAVAAIKAKTDNLPATPADEATASSVKSQTDKLAGAAPVGGSATKDWQLAEQDVVAIGTAGVRNKVHDLTLNISALVGTVVSVRMYKKVNGIERKVYEQVFNAASDPPGLPVINGSWATHDVIRVTLQSNDALDNAKAVDYDYMLEAM